MQSDGIAISVAARQQHRRQVTANRTQRVVAQCRRQELRRERESMAQEDSRRHELEAIVREQLRQQRRELARERERQRRKVMSSLGCDFWGCAGACWGVLDVLGCAGMCWGVLSML